MSIKVIAELEVKNNPGNAVADAHRVRGLYGPCATHIERNAILDDIRRRDMRVITSNDGKQWQLLTAGPWAHDDTDWFEVTGGGGGGSGGDAGAALRAMGNLVPMSVVGEGLQVVDEEIYSVAYRRGSDGANVYNDVVIVASDGGTHHLYSYVPGSVPSAVSPTLIATLPEPGEVYVVTLPAQGTGDVPRTLAYVVGPTVVYEAIQDVTYTSPTGFMGGFLARVTDPLASPPQGILLVTCPSTDRILMLSLQPQAVAGGLPVLLTATPGTSPTGICATDTGNIWVSFPGANIVIEGRIATGPVFLASGISANVTIVSNLVFDGKYVWGLSLGIPATLHRIDAATGVNTAVSLVDVQGTTGVTTSSRVAFDGASIFVTTQGGILFQVHPETLEVLFSSTQLGDEIGAIAVSGYGLPPQLEVAYAVGTGAIPGSLIRVDRGQEESAAFVMERGAFGAGQAARINWPNDVGPASNDSLQGTVRLARGSRIEADHAAALGGYGHHLTGTHSSAISGLSCTISGNYACAGGEVSQASGEASFAYGIGPTIAAGRASFALGSFCQTTSTADSSRACGYGALSRHVGEQSSAAKRISGFGSGSAQRSTYTISAALAGTTTCTDQLGGSFTTQSGYVYGIDASVIVTNSAGTARARFDRRLLVHDAGAGPVIDSEVDVFTLCVGMATADVQFVPSGQNLHVQVINVAAGMAVADLVIQAIVVN